MIRLLTTAEDLRRYDAWVRSHPEGTLWQSLEWKRYQEALGRETRIYALTEGVQILASALVIIDRTTFGFSTWDIPRGPLGPRMDNEKLIIENDRNQLLERTVTDARGSRGLSLYLSPQQSLSTFNFQLSTAPSGRHEQPEATRVIDLAQSEEDILRQMKPKGRYNISVAEKNGVRARESDDVDAFYALLKETQRRDRFSIHPQHHYEAFLKEIPESFLLLAFSAQDKPVAGLLGTIWGKMGMYYYGASDYDHRALMAPYALQWAAMRRCKAQGCTTYDLLGIMPPPSPNNRSTSGSNNLQESSSGEGEGGRGDEGFQERHPWQGVSAFKEKFGGMVITYPPEQEIVLRPMAKKLLQLKRRFIG